MARVEARVAATAAGCRLAWKPPLKLLLKLPLLIGQPTTAPLGEPAAAFPCGSAPAQQRKVEGRGGRVKR